MNPEAYIEMAETESRHWWFVGRRNILSNLLHRLDLPDDARILEVGCGTGGNLEMLGEMGSVRAMELDHAAIELAEAKTSGRFCIKQGACPDQIPYEGPFDLICLFDVLEHIEQDTETLSALNSRLAAGGRIILTVPAHQWLWSSHDEHLHHERRYSRSELSRKAASAGLSVQMISYFNTLLFPLAVATRIWNRMTGTETMSGTRLPPRAVNWLLTHTFSLERRLVGRFGLPTGVSLVAILTAKDLSGR